MLDRGGIPSGTRRLRESSRPSATQPGTPEREAAEHEYVKALALFREVADRVS
jgi:hypothetical protein